MKTLKQAIEQDKLKDFIKERSDKEGDEKLFDDTAKSMIKKSQSTGKTLSQDSS